jgi:hypothetical protein
MNAFRSPIIDAQMQRRNAFAIWPAFHWWQGASQNWYIHSVYQLSEWPAFDWQNYILARLEADGRVTPLYIGQTGDGRDRTTRHEKYLPAILLGATHVHIHLLAHSREARFGIETDLRRGHYTPLNQQSTGSNSLARPVGLL